MSTPDTDPKKPDANPNPNPAPASDDQKPIEKPDSEKTAEELAAEAEAIENEIKEKQKGQTPEQIKANQLRRLEKAREKRDALNNAPDTTVNPQSPAIAVEDLVTLEVQNLDKNSDKAKILQKYVAAGIVPNYKAALTHPGVLGEFKALEDAANAATVIDENDTAARLKTRKEAIAQARATGEVPEDPELKKAIVDDSLSRMSALR